MVRGRRRKVSRSTDGTSQRRSPALRAGHLAMIAAVDHARPARPWTTADAAVVLADRIIVDAVAVIAPARLKHPARIGDEAALGRPAVALTDRALVPNARRAARAGAAVERLTAVVRHRAARVTEIRAGLAQEAFVRDALRAGRARAAIDAPSAAVGGRAALGGPAVRRTDVVR